MKDCDSTASTRALRTTSVARSRVVPLLLCTALLVCACGGGGHKGSNPPPGGSSSPPSVQAGSLQFQAANSTVDENAGSVTLIITRTGGSDGTVTAAVASKDGSTTADKDYAALGTTVVFGAGDAAAKTVTVLIKDDTLAEADETLTLTLSSATGGVTLGANTTATLTILDNDPLPVPELAVGATLKQLTFSWGSIPAATHYRLLESPDGTADFTQVGADLPANATSATLDVAVHRFDWKHALYRLEACTAHGCSATTTNVLSEMLDAIGYFKASNTDLGDRFGTVAISADGNTLAVGAIGEDSKATGVGGDQDDDSLSTVGAVYVFRRDAATRSWSQQAYLKASNAEDRDAFGDALALSNDGNTLAVGALFEASAATSVDNSGVDPRPDTDSDFAPGAGAVYVFARDATTQSWSQQAYLKASNTDAADLFGISLALSNSGTTLAVGAVSEASNATGVNGDEVDDSSDSAGAVYVFTRSETGTWSQQAYVKASNAEQGDNFGNAVALSSDGNTLAVGAPFESSASMGVAVTVDPDGDDDSLPAAGAVYVFARDPTTQSWSQEAYVKTLNTGEQDEFGSAVGLSGDGNTLAVGAPGEASLNGDPADDNAADAGAVYLFTRNGTSWSQDVYLKASNTELADRFGEALFLSADGMTLAVSAPLEASIAQGIDGNQADNSSKAGAVYVFTRATTWSQRSYVKASNTTTTTNPLGLRFGSSVGVSGDGMTLVVGEPNEGGNATGIGGDRTNNSADRAGAVYMY
jgi:hypothetical protein